MTLTGCLNDENERFIIHGKCNEDSFALARFNQRDLCSQHCGSVCGSRLQNASAAGNIFKKVFNQSCAFDLKPNGLINTAETHTFKV